MNNLQTSGVPSFSSLSKGQRMDTNAQQSPSGHKRAAIFIGARVLNAVMEISAGARGHKIVMLVSIMVNVFY